MRRTDPSNRLLLLWWIVAGAAGYSVGGLTEAAMGRSGGITVVVHVAAGGTVAAALQWPALRRHLARAGWWMASGVVGGAAVAAIGAAAGALAGLAAGTADGADAGRSLGSDVAGVAAAILFGVAVGGWQWLLLRRRVARSGWWLPASAVGWVAAGLMAGITEGVAGWAVLGAVYGAITGSVLVWLLGQQASEQRTTQPCVRP